MGRGATGEKSFVKCVSFHKHRERLAKEVAANFAVPWVVEVAGLAFRVEDAVSIAFAER